MQLFYQYLLIIQYVKLLNHKKNLNFKLKCLKTEQIEEALLTPKREYQTEFSAINPFNKKEIPVYVSNFVLMDYGTGAIFGCPAHDQRDFDLQLNMTWKHPVVKEKI